MYVCVYVHMYIYVQYMQVSVAYLICARYCHMCLTNTNLFKSFFEMYSITSTLQIKILRHKDGLNNLKLAQGQQLVSGRAWIWTQAVYNIWMWFEIQMIYSENLFAIISLSSSLSSTPQKQPVSYIFFQNYTMLLQIFV